MKIELTKIQLWILAAFSQAPKGVLRISELCRLTGIGGWCWRRYAIAGGYLNRMAKAGILAKLGSYDGGTYYAVTIEGRMAWRTYGSPVIVKCQCRNSFDDKRLKFTTRKVA